MERAAIRRSRGLRARALESSSRDPSARFSTRFDRDAFPDVNLGKAGVAELTPRERANGGRGDEIVTVAKKSSDHRIAGIPCGTLMSASPRSRGNRRRSGARKR